MSRAMLAILGLPLLVAVPTGTYVFADQQLIEPLRDQAATGFGRCSQPAYPLLTEECQRDLVIQIERRMKRAREERLLVTLAAVLASASLLAMAVRRRRSAKVRTDASKHFSSTAIAPGGAPAATHHR